MANISNITHHHWGHLSRPLACFGRVDGAEWGGGQSGELPPGAGGPLGVEKNPLPLGGIGSMLSLSWESSMTNLASGDGEGDGRCRN